MDKFWNKVVPASVADFKWGEEMMSLGKEKGWEKGIQEIVKRLDNEEFNVFLARMVIKASGMGVVGLDLTARVTWLKELRGK